MRLFPDLVLPVVVGGLIGLVTNWLAIKMLFRPFREYRLFGLRVPFTPGILPRERSRIAKSVGAMVARELITEDALKARLSDPALKAGLEAGIASRLGELLDRDAGAVVAELRAAGGQGALGGPLGAAAAEAWASFLESEAFTSAFARSIEVALESLEDLPLGELVRPDKARDLAAFALAEENAAKLEEGLRRAVERAYLGALAGDAGRAAQGGAAGGDALSGLVSVEAFLPLVERLAEGAYGALVPALESFLRSREVRSALERESVGMVRRVLSRLNPLQRLIVGAAGYERSIEETLPETVDDLLASASAVMRASGMGRRAALAVAERLRALAARPLAEVLPSLFPREAALDAVSAAVAALRSEGPALAERAAAAGARLSLGGLLAELGLPARELGERVAAAAAAGLRGMAPAEGADGGGRLGSALDAFARGLAEGLRGESLGKLLGQGAERRAELSSWLADRALEILRREAGRVVAGVDPERMVVEKIESLDMLETERLVLEVAGRELSWITWLGGVLGALIGLAQGFLTSLPR